MQPAPKREEKEPYTKLKGSKELAEEHFGPVEGLIIAEAKKLELAKFYADKYKLDFADPDVITTATLKAWTRFREFSLIKASEKKIHEEVVRTGLDYDEVLFMTVQAERQKRVIIEIRRLHEQGRSLDNDLRGLAE